MSKTVVITARIDEQLSANLDELAGHRDRSRAWLVEKAVAAFVAEQLDLYRSLAEAEAQFDRGEFLTHEEVMAKFKVKGGDRREAA